MQDSRNGNYQALQYLDQSFSRKAEMDRTSYGRSTIAADPAFERRTLYLFGQPIAHSVSPLFHNTIFQTLGLPWRYIRLDSRDPEDLLWLMHRDDFVGAAVTMPNKVNMAPKLDILTEDARIIGCVNTVLVRQQEEIEVSKSEGDGRENLMDRRPLRRIYIGANTDWIGIKEVLLRRHPALVEELKSRPAMVVGGGATCRSAIYALTEGLGASIVYLVNRDADEIQAVISGLQNNGLKQKLVHLATAEQIESLGMGAPAAIVSAVPDHPPQTDAERLARHIVTMILNLDQRGPPLPNIQDGRVRGVLLEMCYDPSPWTAIAQLASDAGWKVVTGMEVIRYQAIEQSVLWTERPTRDLPFEKANAAIQAAFERKQKL